MQYTDPDGMITQHTDLTGHDRMIAEIKDIIGATCKIGLSAGFKVKEFGVFSLSTDVDAGSMESTQDQNGVKTEDTAALSLKLDVLGFGEISIGGKLNAPAVVSDKFLDHVVNAYQNGKGEGEVDASITVKEKGSVKAENKKGGDLKLEAGAQFGVGGSLWINLSEVKDLAKYFLNPKDENK